MKDAKGDIRFFLLKKDTQLDVSVGDEGESILETSPIVNDVSEYDSIGSDYNDKDKSTSSVSDDEIKTISDDELDDTKYSKY